MAKQKKPEDSQIQGSDFLPESGDFETGKEEVSPLLDSKPEDRDPEPRQLTRDPASSGEKSVPTVIMTELDSIIHERIKAQPKTLDDISQVTRTEAPGLHRLSLPPYFEAFSYDCTRGSVCEVHRKNGKDVTGRGRFIMRWILKDKRAVDQAINIRGWMLANQALFPDAPNYLFSTSGAIENGDALLAVMPVEKAMKIREFPRVRSQELLRSRMTPSKKKSNRVLMTGDPDQEHVYEPDMGKDESSSGEGSAAQPGSLQEGRDF